MGNGNTELPPVREAEQPAEKRPVSPEGVKEVAAKTFEKENLARMRLFHDKAEEFERKGDYEEALELNEEILKRYESIKKIDVDKLNEKAMEGAIRCLINLIQINIENGVKILSDRPFNLALPHFNKTLKYAIKAFKFMYDLPSHIKSKYPPPIQMAIAIINQIENKDTGFSDYLKNTGLAQAQKKPKPVDEGPSYPSSPRLRSFFKPDVIHPLLKMRPQPKKFEIPVTEDDVNYSEYLSLKAELFGNAYPKRKSTIWQFEKATKQPDLTVAIENKEKKRVRIHERERMILGLLGKDPLALLHDLTKIVSQKREITEENEARVSDRESYILRKKISDIAVVLSSILERVKNNDPHIVKKRGEIGIVTESKQLEQLESGVGMAPVTNKWEKPAQTLNFFIDGIDNLIYEWLSGKKFIREDQLLENMGNMLHMLCSLMPDLYKYEEVNEKRDTIPFSENTELKAIEERMNEMLKEFLSNKKSPEYMRILAEQLQLIDEKKGLKKTKEGEDSIDPRVEYVIYCHSIELYLNAIKPNPDKKEKYEALFNFLDKIGFGADMIKRFRKEFEKIDQIKNPEIKKREFVAFYQDIKREIESKIKYVKILSPQIMI